MIIYTYTIYFDNTSETGYKWENDIIPVDISNSPDIMNAVIKSDGNILEHYMIRHNMPSIVFIHQDKQKLTDVVSGLVRMWELCFDHRTRPKFNNKENKFYKNFIKGINNG
jgi:hypothetical protein